VKPAEPLAIALKILARRAYSEAEVRRRLERGTFTPGEIDAAIARLKELRYLDDRAYALDRAAALLGSRKMAPAQVAAKLAAAGVAGRDADAAVEQARAGASELELARLALAKRRPRVDESAPARERDRAARWLMSRGFTEEAARALLGLTDESPPEST
jgi:regulatory protein